MIRDRVSLFKDSNYIKEFRKQKIVKREKKLVSKKKGKQVPSHLPTKIKQKKRKKSFFFLIFSPLQICTIGRRSLVVTRQVIVLESIL